MNWQDEGFLLSKIKFRENANIINVFTNTHGKVSGIVYGGNSRKIRNFLQISNKIFVFYTSKNENRIGYFKTELVEAISPQYFNHKRSSRLIAMMRRTSRCCARRCCHRGLSGRALSGRTRRTGRRSGRSSRCTVAISWTNN